MGEQGLDTATIWQKVKDIVIKTLKKSREQEASHNSDYRLLGCDIFLDSLHEPHLLKFNTMPNLNTEQESRRRTTKITRRRKLAWMAELLLD